MASEKELVDKLTARLSQLKANRDLLAQVIGTAKTIHEQATVTRVFPKGIVAPEGFSLETELSAGQLTLVGELLQKHDGIRGIEVFPIGIVVPDKFRAVINIG